MLGMMNNCFYRVRYDFLTNINSEKEAVALSFRHPVSIDGTQGYWMKPQDTQHFIDVLKIRPGLIATFEQHHIKEFSVEEVREHNNETSCWIIVNNQVYDVTSYLNSHPG